MRGRLQWSEGEQEVRTWWGARKGWPCFMEQDSEGRREVKRDGEGVRLLVAHTSIAHTGWRVGAGRGPAAQVWEGAQQRARARALGELPQGPC